ncbi:unnamed protein product [Bursaphelenchus xylophilus]|uniref:(pine wood nematode) hypothetical protein n=1 Tax=Bursaphelenchus xylophilus TaxID=6326 RepID=A0A1I7RIA5_BURXY|nr:unnamed protein product [Bursaphelenchus xylophilus]CAG9115046.1 unnamed protein product [Bursaphelenchus xylophilus]
MADQVEVQKPTKISFNVKKQVVSNVVQGKDAHSDHEDDQQEITHLEGGLVNGIPKEKKKDPVIERRKDVADWRIKRLLQLKEEGHATDSQLATLRLLQEARGDVPVSEGAMEVTENEKESKAKTLSKTDEEADDCDPDYDKISYNDFGYAFLRGLGWKKEEGLGKTNKRAVPLMVYEKAKIFKLNTEKAVRPNQKDADKNEPAPQLAEGVPVFIEDHKKYKGCYGRLKFMDDITRKAVVRLTTGEEVETSVLVLTAITEKEFTAAGKTINKKTYEQEEKRIRDQNDQRNGRENGKSEKYKPEKKKPKEESDDDIEIIEASTSEMWVAPSLLVRMIDKKYKKGDYYKQKMVVVDAASRDHCELRDDRGRIHTLRQAQLETVIPRELGTPVMFVTGKHKGRAGRLVEKDKERERLWVSISGIDDPIKAHFDDVCEYKGQLEELEY